MRTTRKRRHRTAARYRSPTKRSGVVPRVVRYGRRTRHSARTTCGDWPSTVGLVVRAEAAEAERQRRNFFLDFLGTARRSSRQQQAPGRARREKGIGFSSPCAAPDRRWMCAIENRAQTNRCLYRGASERVKTERHRVAAYRPRRWSAQKERPAGIRRASQAKSRQRPTLPRSCPRSTIGAEGLNDRVRNGNGCGPLAMVTGKLNSQVGACYAAPRLL